MLPVAACGFGCVCAHVCGPKPARQSSRRRARIGAPNWRYIGNKLPLAKVARLSRARQAKQAGSQPASQQQRRPVSFWDAQFAFPVCHLSARFALRASLAVFRFARLGRSLSGGSSALAADARATADWRPRAGASQAPTRPARDGRHQFNLAQPASPAS